MSARPSASVVIDAPLDLVWQVMLDTASYGDWNPFVYQVECASPAQVGDPIVLHVRWANGRTTTSPEQVTAVAPPHASAGGRTALLAYEFVGWPDRLGLVHSIRHQRITEQPNGTTRYETHQDLTGPLVRLAGPARITDGFERHAQGLKARAESLHRG